MFEFKDSDQKVKVYLSSPITGEHIGESTILVQANTGLPANAHIEEPLANDGSACVFVEGAWGNIKDNRDSVVYKKSTGQASTVSELGEISSEFTLLKPEQFDSWLDGEWVIDKIKSEKSTQQKIDELENSVTPRNYREFVMGVQYSIDKINKVDADIELLRAEL